VYLCVSASSHGRRWANRRGGAGGRGSRASESGEGEPLESPRGTGGGGPRGRRIGAGWHMHGEGFEPGALDEAAEALLDMGGSGRQAAGIHAGVSGSCMGCACLLLVQLRVAGLQRGLFSQQEGLCV
jgi:hypothetical protein